MLVSGGMRQRNKLIPKEFNRLVAVGGRVVTERERERERERESFIRNNLHNGVVSGAARGHALLGPRDHQLCLDKFPISADLGCERTADHFTRENKKFSAGGAEDSEDPYIYTYIHTYIHI